MRLTGVWVFGIDDGDGRAHRGVVEHRHLVVAGGELRLVVVHVLHHEPDVGLARSAAAVRRLGHQVELCIRLPVQHSEG